MNITFLIGNGFDINLGLKTTYAEFIKNYINETDKLNDKPINLSEFYQHIKNDEKLWAKAEIALGKYTGNFEKGEGMAFSECHQDLCEHLVEYLKKEETRISYESSADKVLSAFKNIVHPETPFPTQERNAIRAPFSMFESQPYRFNFLCFNYTSTLDKCLDIVRNSVGALGNHAYRNTNYNHAIGQLCHVHGTVEKEIVFAVNDETQIAKPDIFDFEDGDICKHLLIKQQANESYLENTDNIANQILQSSTIVYIYGMSIGETDKLWWSRICKWLNGSNERHLIIHNHEMPIKGVYPLIYQLAEKKKKQEFLAYSDFDDNTRSSLLNRIHITGYNIFSDIENVAINDCQTKSVVEDALKKIVLTKKKAE